MTKKINDDKSRKSEEIEFHNLRESDRILMPKNLFFKKYPNKNFYSIDRINKKYLSDWLNENIPGKITLDYCCGTGIQSVEMAKIGATVYGIDISNVEIQTAINRVKNNNLYDRVTFKVMDAEQMDFNDNFFDVIVCTGVLHHLDLNRAFPEISRVLKKGGLVICLEALGYNPLINLYRKLTPHLRTRWEIDHILTLKEIKQGLNYFTNVDIKYFHLLTLLAIPLRNNKYFYKILSFLEFFDKILLSIPIIRLLAWQVYFVYKK
jgi:ubiquinone/menaquinone biosynthesis C-methylase UbiE